MVMDVVVKNAKERSSFFPPSVFLSCIRGDVSTKRESQPETEKRRDSQGCQTGGERREMKEESQQSKEERSEGKTTEEIRGEKKDKKRREEKRKGESRREQSRRVEKKAKKPKRGYQERREERL